MDRKKAAVTAAAMLAAAVAGCAKEAPPVRVNAVMEAPCLRPAYGRCDAKAAPGPYVPAWYERFLADP